MSGIVYKRKIQFCLLIIIAIGGLLLLAQQPLSIIKSLNFAHAQGAATVPEGKDFATHLLRDPWDMSEFSDVSQYINESGQRNAVTNIQVQNGVFLGTSVDDVLNAGNGWFFTLFPGYQTSIHTGKVGSRYPIDSSEYQCLYIAMKVNSPAANHLGPDQFRIFWFTNDLLNTGGAPFGITNGIQVYPEAGAAQPVPLWQLLEIDLQNPSNGIVPNTTAWNEQIAWQGIRIDPTINRNIDFSVDWVRLTPCKPDHLAITWTPDASLTTMWLHPVGTNRNIRVNTTLDGSSGNYSLDTQGIQPGDYVINLSNSKTSCCSVENVATFTINQSPIVSFTHPTFYSGPDYAEQAGDAWDFSESGDVSSILNVASSDIGNGMLDIVTNSGFPPGGIDAQIFLHTPQEFNTNDYYYLSVRMHTDKPWQNVPEGMIVRWIWTIPSLTGWPGYECHLVSNDIPYDIGWQTYTIDLRDALAGSVELTSPLGPPHCPDISDASWLATSPVIQARFDPNENIMGSSLHQQIDWIRLTRMHEVNVGDPLIVQVSLNKPPAEIWSMVFYYTNDLGQPTQHIADGVIVPTAQSYIVKTPAPSQVSTVNGNTRIYLPIIMRGYPSPPELPPVENEIRFQWDTSTVMPGEYHLCAVTDDGYNQTTFCNEAPVLVNP